MNNSDELSGDLPLVVDLDGTLIRTDSLHEVFLRLLRHKPLSALACLISLRKGKAEFKQQVAACHPAIPLDELPLNEDFGHFLASQQAAGRKLFLASASHHAQVSKIAEDYGGFEGFLGSEGENIKGSAKAGKLVEMFGEEGFDYAGNSSADMPIWRHARQALIVNPDRGVADAVSALGKASRIFDDRPMRSTDILRAMRPHQWMKNSLLMVPMIAAHQFDLTSLVLAVIAVIAFSLTASGIYVLNDLMDLAADRLHPRKKNRPFAAGRLSIPFGLLLFSLLILCGLVLASLLPPAFWGVMALYVMVTTSYSFYLKRVAVVDVLLLAGLYSLRIFAGGVALSIPLSFWLIAFSTFLFLSLSLVKRYAELGRHMEREPEGDKLPGRGYGAADLPLLREAGIGAGLMSALILAFYFNSPEVAELYSNPALLWLGCPVFLYWILMIWLQTVRGNMHDDPVIFALTDKSSLLAGVLFASFIALASLL